VARATDGRIKALDLPKLIAHGILIGFVGLSLAFLEATRT